MQTAVGSILLQSQTNACRLAVGVLGHFQGCLLLSPTGAINHLASCWKGIAVALGTAAGTANRADSKHTHADTREERER